MIGLILNNNGYWNRTWKHFFFLITPVARHFTFVSTSFFTIMPSTVVGAIPKLTRTKRMWLFYTTDEIVSTGSKILSAEPNVTDHHYCPRHLCFYVALSRVTYHRMLHFFESSSIESNDLLSYYIGRQEWHKQNEMPLSRCPCLELWTKTPFFQPFH